MTFIKESNFALEEEVEAWGSSLNFMASVSTSKCHRHFGRCILKAKGLQGFDTI